MATVRMTIEYDGTDFVGWQVQPSGRTVQEEIERALRQILQKPLSVVGGGRTDTGVHARGQVASFQTEGAVDPAGLRKSLNGVLPEDIIIRDLAIVDDAFHARYSATARRYVYYIRRQPTAVERRYCWQLFYALEVPKLHEAAAIVKAAKEFRAFCKSDSGVDNTLCEIRRAEWTESGDRLQFEIVSNRFLYGMVRALVGTMVDVARGFTSMEEFRSLLDGAPRSAAGMSAPDKGLFLEEIVYEKN